MNQFRRFFSDFFNFRPAFTGGHECDALAHAVDGQADVQLFADVSAFFNQQPPDFLAVRARLMRHQLHSQDLAGVVAHLIDGFGDFDAAAFAASARVNLGLDDPDAPPQFARDLDGLLDRYRRFAARHGDSIRAQDFLALIFMNLHSYCLVLQIIFEKWMEGIGLKTAHRQKAHLSSAFSGRFGAEPYFFCQTARARASSDSRNCALSTANCASSTACCFSSAMILRTPKRAARCATRCSAKRASDKKPSRSSASSVESS